MNWGDVINFANNGNPKPPRRDERSEEEWRELLAPERFYITRLKGTEVLIRARCAACSRLGAMHADVAVLNCSIPPASSKAALAGPASPNLSIPLLWHTIRMEVTGCVGSRQHATYVMRIWGTCSPMALTLADCASASMPFHSKRSKRMQDDASKNGSDQLSGPIWPVERHH